MSTRMKQIEARMLDLADEIAGAINLINRAHAVMLRCHWNEPTGLEGDEDSALEIERDVREFLGK